MELLRLIVVHLLCMCLLLSITPCCFLLFVPSATCHDHHFSPLPYWQMLWWFALAEFVFETSYVRMHKNLCCKFVNELKCVVWQ